MPENAETRAEWGKSLGRVRSLVVEEWGGGGLEDSRWTMVREKREEDSSWWIMAGPMREVAPIRAMDLKG